MKTKMLGLLALTLGGLCVQAHAITYMWSIDKTARQSELQLSQGQSFQVNYQVSVARDPDFDFDGDNTANVL